MKMKSYPTSYKKRRSRIELIKNSLRGLIITYAVRVVLLFGDAVRGHRGHRPDCTDVWLN